jgi:hypothetical protein
MWNMSYYDRECLERYGIHTCIFIEIEPDTFQFRLLDNRYSIDKKETHQYVVARNKLFELVPKMLMYKYTVVIAEQRTDSQSIITAVHLPVQHQLTTPPILQ